MNRALGRKYDANARSPEEMTDVRTGPKDCSKGGFIARTQQCSYERFRVRVRLVSLNYEACVTNYVIMKQTRLSQYHYCHLYR
jgi:hypothetical protein